MEKMDLKVKILLGLMSVTALGVFLIGCTVQYNTYQYHSPCACDKCVSEDNPWFLQRFNKSVEPFLSTEFNLTESTFNWWRVSDHFHSHSHNETGKFPDSVEVSQQHLVIFQRLQGERGSLSTYSKIVDGLFQEFPVRPPVEKPSPHRCRTCSVVGNSGNLKGSRYGPMINFHDIVIR